MSETLAHVLGAPVRAQDRLRRLSDRTPLRVKLVAVLLVLVTVALGVAGVATTAALRGYLLNRVDTQLFAARDSLNAWVQGGISPDVPRDRTRLPPTNYPVQVYDPTGRLVGWLTYDRRADQAPPEVGAMTITRAERLDGRAFTVAARGGGPAWRVTPIPLPGGAGSLVVATSMGDAESTLRRLTLLELGVGLVVLVLLGVIGLVVVRRSLQPLVEVETTAEAIADGDLSRRVPDRDPRTEVGRLARAVNGMLTQIETAFRASAASEASARASEERMRRFVADASHELRTPLTTIRGFAELYRQGAVADPEDVARLMRRIEDEAVRMGLLVEDLLLLARLDQQRPLRREPVDLLTLAGDAVLGARAVDPERPIDLQVRDGPAAPVVIGDEARLRQVLGNLVTNALVHTPPKTPVTVRLTTTAAAVGGRADGESPAPTGIVAVLEVRDEGPGLTATEAQRVFERFYRGDPSRTRDRPGGGPTPAATGGTGLGLSIVAALTAAHGGRVEVESSPGAGATFRVLLPVAAAPGAVGPRVAEEEDG